MTVYSNERMLVFAPHVDDTELGMGGWIVRALEEKVGEFFVRIGGNGNYVNIEGKTVHWHDRVKECHASLQHLGIPEANVDFMNLFEENKAMETSYPRMVGQIETIIGILQPTEIFVCLPGFNQDHRRLFDCVITALRPGMFPSVKNVWAYPYPGSCWGTELPQWGKTYIKLQAHHVEAKMKALDRHKSQFEGRSVVVGPHLAFENMRNWGAEIGEKYAEVFYLLREINR